MLFEIINAEDTILQWCSRRYLRRLKQTYYDTINQVMILVILVIYLNGNQLVPRRNPNIYTYRDKGGRELRCQR